MSTQERQSSSSSSSRDSHGSTAFSWRKFWAYTGPGWLMSMAYLDPGNLEADLQSGAYTRYELLYVVLLSTMAGGCYQILAARLGVCTGRHLAQLCREEYPKAVSFVLWIMTELAIIGSDIQEVLGSAIALQILFGLPLWVGCLITGLDTFTFLALHHCDSKNGSSSRFLEMLFMLLIGIMCVCFFVDFGMSAPSGLQILEGLVVPRMKKQDVMQAVGTLGSIIMPHNIFLHSALVQVRGINPVNRRAVREANYYFSLEAVAALFMSFLINSAVICVFASSFYSSACAALGSDAASAVANAGIQTACIPSKAAIESGSSIYDALSGQLCSLTSFGSNATSIGSCTVCYVDGHAQSSATLGYCQEIGLSAAGEAVGDSLGEYARVIWAVGLLASGQASTMTGTYAGQFVMEGFRNIEMVAWKRVLLTRSVALVPALAVAIVSESHSFRSDLLSELLNVLQSVQLPFALLPLLTFTSNRRLMGDRFVNSHVICALLFLGTLLLCGINYALVYSILASVLPSHLSLIAWIALGLGVAFYAVCLLYLIVVHPIVSSSWFVLKQRRRGKGQSSTEDMDMANESALLPNEV